MKTASNKFHVIGIPVKPSGGYFFAVIRAESGSQLRVPTKTKSEITYSTHGRREGAVGYFILSYDLT